MKLFTLLFLVFTFSSAAFAESNKCQAKAEKVILNKGKLNKESIKLLLTKPWEPLDPQWEGYDIAIEVKTHRMGTFTQVCRIAMKKSNCSYDNYYSCAATEEDLDNPEQPNDM